MSIPQREQELLAEVEGFKRNEIDLRNEIMHLKEACADLELWRQTFQGKSPEEVLKEWQACCEELQRTRVELGDTTRSPVESASILKAEHAALESKCAEMRGIIERLIPFASAYSSHPKRNQDDKLVEVLEQAKHALSTDCGKRFVRVEELKPTIKFF